LGKDLGGCDTTNESWRTGKDLVGKSAEYVGFVGGELEKGEIPFFAGAIPYWIATLHALCATIAL
jgi:hypothetical protein